MCLSLYDYQSKASRYSNRLAYLQNRVTTNQKHTIDSHTQKTQKEENSSKQNKNENHQTTKGKTKRKKRNKEEIQNQLENKV